jgi:hypothetical protein
LDDFEEVFHLILFIIIGRCALLHSRERVFFDRVIILAVLIVLILAVFVILVILTVLIVLVVVLLSSAVFLHCFLLLHCVLLLYLLIYLFGFDLWFYFHWLLNYLELTDLSNSNILLNLCLRRLKISKRITFYSNRWESVLSVFMN